jgi:hypothetical protein
VVIPKPPPVACGKGIMCEYEERKKQILRDCEGIHKTNMVSAHGITKSASGVYMWE